MFYKECISLSFSYIKFDYLNHECRLRINVIYMIEIQNECKF